MNKFGSQGLKNHQPAPSRMHQVASSLRKMVLAGVAGATVWGLGRGFGSVGGQPAKSGTAAAAPTGAPIQLALVESLSGPFANTGEAVFRNILMATERVNARVACACRAMRPPSAGGAAL
jgi:branched-chain amino acid transport system substrate-binding protein